MQNYFSLLGMPLSFDVDLAALEKKYFEAQRKYHPDRMVGKSAAERQQSIAQSMHINEAYEALKSPLKRAQHMLALSGILLGDIPPSEEVLTEVMELREALQDASLEEAGKLAEHSEKERRKILVALSEAFSEMNRPEAGRLCIRLSYILKLEDEIKARLKAKA